MKKMKFDIFDFIAVFIIFGITIFWGPIAVIFFSLGGLYAAIVSHVKTKKIWFNLEKIIENYEKSK